MAQKAKAVTVKAESRTYEIAAEKFADAVVYGGWTQGEAYRLSHPQCSLTGGALRVKACEYAKKPLVAELIEARRQDLRERNAGFGERMVGYLREEIDQCFRENHTLDPVMKQANLAADVLGLRKQSVDMTAQIGPLDASNAADKINFLARMAKGDKKA